jgi:hypothetical protein
MRGARSSNASKAACKATLQSNNGFASANAVQGGRGAGGINHGVNAKTVPTPRILVRGAFSWPNAVVPYSVPFTSSNAACGKAPLERPVKLCTASNPPDVVML